jgi:hypothetical protein
MSRSEFLLKVTVRCRHRDDPLCVPVDHPVPPDFQCQAGGSGVGPVFGGGRGCICRADTIRIVQFAQEAARSSRWDHWRRMGGVVFEIT